MLGVGERQKNNQSAFNTYMRLSKKNLINKNKWLLKENCTLACV